MTDLLTPDPVSTPDNPNTGDHLGAYAQRAYLEYALSVVKGRALPDVCDGQKPVQRRIVFDGPHGFVVQRPQQQHRRQAG